VARSCTWAPAFNAQSALDRYRETEDWRGPLALAVGEKPYHNRTFEDGPFPVEADPYSSVS
jgi:UDP-glucose 4-epimerase